MTFLPLWLLAAHMVGDFVFQSRWQAAGKLTDWRVRWVHVNAYTLAFVPVAFVAAPWTRAVPFLWALLLLHWLTDSRRFHSTVGDWFGWGWRTQIERRSDWLNAVPGATAGRTSDSLPPNPWSPIPILIDQTLHLVQIAALASLFLR